MVWELVPESVLETGGTPLQVQDGCQHTVHGETESGETVLTVLYCPYNGRQLGLSCCLRFAGRLFCHASIKDLETGTGIYNRCCLYTQNKPIYKTLGCTQTKE